MNRLGATLRSVSIGFTVATLAWAALPAQAEPGDAPSPPPASPQQRIGLVSGLALGAVAGGPVGAIVGGAAGAWVGERYHRQAAAHKEAATSLKESEAGRARLAQQLAELHDATDEVQTDVSFRTDEDILHADAVPPLLKLGALAAALPDVRVRIVGYADARGSAEYNMELSQRRAQAVADLLAMSGIDRQRLLIEARGKSQASGAPGDTDAYALDRRVSVRIERLQPVARNE